MKIVSRLLFLLSLSVFGLTQCRQPGDQLEVDVLVVGGGTGGISAGIQAARLGVETLIVEEGPWLGGMLTSAGVSATDGNHELYSGLWEEFRAGLRAHYGSAEALATGWVSFTQFEPHVGDSIFKAMAVREPDLRLRYGYYPVSVVKSQGRVTGVTFESESGERLGVKAEVVIDATQLGDVLALAGAGYDLGMESRHDTGEAMAPESANGLIQDLTWVAVLKDYGIEDQEYLLDQPANYHAADFAGACTMTVDSILLDCTKMLSYARLPNNKYMINWPRHGNDVYLNVVELDREERRRELEAARLKTLQFVYYIQQELGFRQLGLADDEFPTADRLALEPYHREGRRMHGVVRMTLNHVTNRYDDALYQTGISVGDYPVDHHHLCKDDAPELHFPAVPSFSIPLGALIPDTLNALIAASKAISVSNLINGSTRLQPVVLLTGQAAGVLAALSVKNRQEVREVPVRQVQQVLLDAGAYLLPTYDVHPGNPDFQAIQRICASGWLELTGEPWKWANRSWFYPDSVLSKETIQAILAEQGVSGTHHFQAMTRRQFAVLADSLWHPFEQDIDHQGRKLSSAK